ncbi:MAG: winged helix-turn-helix domain-containing protein [Pseudomonadota bacterium]
MQESAGPGAVQETVWAFDSFRLSQSEGLKQDGAAVMLEPKTLDVLIYLVRHRDRIVSRDDLLEAVWGETVVEEAVLSQTIFKLRKQLGDSAKTPRFITTYHRRGYQFIHPLQTQAMPSGPASSRSPMLLVGTVIVLMALLLLVLNGLNDDSAQSPLPTLGFMPVEIESEDPGAELIGQTFDDLLFKRLSQQPGLITRTRTLGSLQLEPLPDDVFEYADQQRVDWVLRGSVAPSMTAQRVWLDMELVRIGDGVNQNFPLDRFELPLPGQSADLEQLLDARNHVAGDIGNYIGIALLRQSRSANDPSSLESMRLLLLGLQELAQLQCGGQLAVNYLRQAVDIDPQLTDAWVALGYAYFNEVWACGGNVDYLHQAARMAEQALALEPGNVQARPLEIQLLASLGRPREGLLNMLTVLREQPDKAILHFYASLLFNYAGLLDRSEWHLDRALALDPFVLGTDVSDPPLLPLYRAQWQDFLDTLVAVDSPYHRFYKGYALWQLGDLDQARAVLGAFDDQDWQTVPFIAYGQALLDVIEGRRAEASRKVAATHDRRHANGIRDGEMTFKEAWLMSLAGEDELAMDYLERTIEQGFTCSECMANSPFVGLMTETDRYMDLTARVRESEQEWSRRLADRNDPETLMIE